MGKRLSLRRSMTIITCAYFSLSHYHLIANSQNGSLLENIYAVVRSALINTDLFETYGLGSLNLVDELLENTDA